MKTSSSLDPDSDFGLVDSLDADSDLDSAACLDPLPGHLVLQFIRCGKAGCRCAYGHKHGPYFYRVWREDKNVFKAYVKKNDVAKVREQTLLYERILEELMQLIKLRKAALKRLGEQRATLAKSLKTMSPQQAARPQSLSTQGILASAHATIENAQVIIEASRYQRAQRSEKRMQRALEKETHSAAD